jgi:NAD(P)-dependent dehydrogenase (short-subunit alcohol dehydrogenase family)
VGSVFELNNRVVLLTGAAGRLGSAMTKAIVAAGAELVICGRHVESLEVCRNTVPAAERARCHVVPADVTRDDGVLALQREIEHRFGVLNGLVNNAYAGRVGAIEAIGTADFLLACQYNLMAPFMLVKAFRDLLQVGARGTAGTSSIVNIASMYGTVSPDPDIYGASGKNNPAHYGASKAGLIQLTRYLACHLAPSDIRANSIAPGPFPDTTVDAGIPFFYERLAARVPMKRVGSPPEVGGPVVFLLSEASSYVNGVNLPVDGGWTAW